MSEQHLLLLKEKIIKTDAVISLLAERNFKQNQLQAKLQFLFEKFVEKSREAEILHAKVCQCIEDHEPLTKRVADLETRYSDLEMRHNKLVNTSELKLQVINEELEALKKKNEELLKANRELKTRRLPTKTNKKTKISSVSDDEIDFLKTENDWLSLQVEKLTWRCDEESKEIGRLSSLLTETRVPDRSLILQADAERTAKLEVAEDRLRKEVKALKKERVKLSDELAELRLERNLLGEDVQETRDAERLSVPFVETGNESEPKEIVKLDVTGRESNRDLVALEEEQNELEKWYDDPRCDINDERSMEIESSQQTPDIELKAELRAEKNLLKTTSTDLEEETFKQVDLAEADFSKSGNEESDAESVTDLLREMIWLPVALEPFGDDSCSEIEDFLGFPAAEDENCRVCAHTVPKTAPKTRISTNKNEKLLDYRRRKRKAIAKKKHSNDSVLIRRLRTTITRDVFRCMDRYFGERFETLKKIGDCRCDCERTSARFRKNKELIRQKVEKLREIKCDDTSNSESESRPAAKRTKRHRVKSVELIASPPQINNVESAEKKTPEMHVEQNHSGTVLAKENIRSEKRELEVISQDSGYARSEADSLELEARSSEKTLSNSTSFNNALEPKRRCKKTATHNSKTPDVKHTSKKSATNKLINKVLQSTVSINCDRKKSIEKDRSRSEEINFDSPLSPEGQINFDSPLSSKDQINCDSPLSPEDKINFDNPLLPENQINFDSPLSPENQINFESPLSPENQINLDSPLSPEDQINFDSPLSPEDRFRFDSFKLLSPLSASPIKMNVHEHDDELVNSCETRGAFVTEEASKRLKDDGVSEVAGVAKTSFKRPNCARRLTRKSCADAEKIKERVTRVLNVAVERTERDRSFPSESQVVAAKPPPVQKFRAMKKVQANNLFRELLNFGNEPTAVDQIASKFAGQNKKHIASLILSEIRLHTAEKIDMKYTPPAPPLTRAQRLLLGFMYKLDEPCGIPGLLEAFLDAAERALLAETNLEHLQQVARLYAAVCKFKKDLDRMRRTVCDVFYFSGDLAVPFLFTVLSSWIEVLPLRAHSAGDALVEVLVQVVNSKSCTTPGYNLSPLKSLLKHHYEYPTESRGSNEVFREVFDSYLDDPTKLNEYAILILCKNHPAKWVLQQIDAHVKKILENCERPPLKAKVAAMVAHISAQFHPSEAVEQAKLKKLLDACLQGDPPLEPIRKSSEIL